LPIVLNRRAGTGLVQGMHGYSPIARRRFYTRYLQGRLRGNRATGVCPEPFSARFRPYIRLRRQTRRHDADRLPVNV
jgi:hypothetical protein